MDNKSSILNNDKKLMFFIFLIDYYYLVVQKEGILIVKSWPFIEIVLMKPIFYNIRGLGWTRKNLYFKNILS